MSESVQASRELPDRTVRNCSQFAGSLHRLDPDADEADLRDVEFRDGGCFADSSGSCSGDPRFDDQQMPVTDSLETEVVAWYTAFRLAPAFFRL